MEVAGLGSWLTSIVYEERIHSRAVKCEELERFRIVNTTTAAEEPNNLLHELKVKPKASQVALTH